MSQPSRRDALKTMSCGFGYMALAGLLGETARAAESLNQNPLSPKAPHFKPRAKRVIFMFMQGGPSHVDTFDYKPMLLKDDGKPAPQHGGGKKRTLSKGPFKWQQHGESGLWLSSLWPHLSKHADDLCLLNSMHTDLPNHPQAAVQMHTGNFQFVRPSMGAWVLYGLGTENQELPGFVTINPLRRIGGAQNFGSAFLPAAYQGTPIEGQGKDAIAHLANKRFTLQQQKKQLELLQSFNRDRLEQDQVNTELEGLIESYELGHRMQGAVPDVMDFSKESADTLKAYGVNEKATSNFGRQCLLARRFAEAGVRFIELTTTGWDQHRSLKAKLTQNCTGIDKPMAALIKDLKDRGMLEDTLIVWGGEFGRTPGAAKEDGRDHNGGGFSMFMAGGGVRGGMRYGATDDYGIAAVENKMHIHDLHATILYLLGLNHEQLTYRYSGRDFRLTDVHGNVANEILA